MELQLESIRKVLTAGGFGEANYLKKSLSENGSSKFSNIISVRDLKDEKIRIIYIENKNGIMEWETL